MVDLFITASREPICDFCSSPAPAWLFPCHTYDLPPLPGDPPNALVRRSIDQWVACAPCAALIRAGDRSGVTRRSLLALRPRYPGFTAGHLRRRIELVQSGFWRDRDPAAEPIPFADWAAIARAEGD